MYLYMATSYTLIVVIMVIKIINDSFLSMTKREIKSMLNPLEAQEDKVRWKRILHYQYSL